MNSEIFGQFGKVTESMDKFVAPAREIASLNLDYFEKVADLQLDAAKAYADLGIQQVRAALSVSDAQGLQEYVKAQSETVSTVGQRVQDDAQKVVSLSKDYAEKAQKVAQENASTIIPAAAGNK